MFKSNRSYSNESQGWSPTFSPAPSTMATHYPTPSTPTPTPATELDNFSQLATKVPTGSQMLKNKGPRTPFEKQQTNDRKACKRHIDNKISSKTNKLVIAAAEDKFRLIKKLWEEKILEREEDGKGSTRLTFPNEHSQEAEDKWLRSIFRLILDQSRDQDDPEPLPGVKVEAARQDEDTGVVGGSQGKVSSLRSKAPMSYPAESDEDSDRDNDEDSQRAEKETSRKKRKFSSGTVECSPCSRALAIQPNVSGGSAAEADDGGVDDGERGERVRRAWKWVGFELKVCEVGREGTIVRVL